MTVMRVRMIGIDNEEGDDSDEEDDSDDDDLFTGLASSYRADLPRYD